jgi:hypothetical protein
MSGYNPACHDRPLALLQNVWEKMRVLKIGGDEGVIITSLRGVL